MKLKNRWLHRKDRLIFKMIEKMSSEGISLVNIAEIAFQMMRISSEAIARKD